MPYSKETALNAFACTSPKKKARCWRSSRPVPASIPASIRTGWWCLKRMLRPRCCAACGRGWWSEDFVIWQSDNCVISFARPLADCRLSRLRLEVVGGGEMKKRKSKGGKDKRQSKPAKATTAGRVAVKAGRGSSLSGLDFKPVVIRGEP